MSLVPGGEHLAALGGADGSDQGVGPDKSEKGGLSSGHSSVLLVGEGDTNGAQHPAGNLWEEELVSQLISEVETLWRQG